MKNASRLLLYSLREVPPRYKTLFGLEIEYSRVIDVHTIVLGEIGNVALADFSFVGKVCDYTLCLPCDLYSIHSVTSARAYTNYNIVPEAFVNKQSGVTITSLSLVPYTNVFNEFGQYVGRIDALNSAPIAPATGYNNNAVGPPVGNYINYNRAGNNKIKINTKEAEIEVIFETVVVDEEGYPLVEEKAITAIAYYLFHLHVHRGYFMKIYDGNQVKLAKDDADTWIGRARVGQTFSDNEQNDIFQAGITHNRKIYGLPYRTT